MGGVRLTRLLPTRHRQHNTSRPARISPICCPVIRSIHLRLESVSFSSWTRSRFSMQPSIVRGEPQQRSFQPETLAGLEQHTGHVQVPHVHTDRKAAAAIEPCKNQEIAPAHIQQPFGNHIIVYTIRVFKIPQAPRFPTPADVGGGVRKRYHHQHQCGVFRRRQHAPIERWFQG